MSTTDIVTVRRLRMRGDVLLCTPIVRAIKERLHPESPIFVETEFPELFRNNPIVRMAARAVPKRDPYIYDLGIHFERLPGWHIIDALALGAGFKPGVVPRKLEMFLDAGAVQWAKQQTASLRDYIVIAAGPGLWAGRNLAEEKWVKIARKLMNRGERIVLVGNEVQYNIPNTKDLRMRTTTFNQLAAVIKGAKLFIGIDSFPVHVAGAMNTPRVAVFGVTRPECILCDSPNTFPVSSDPNHPLTGARHRVSTMRLVDVNTPHGNPMDTIGTGDVMREVNKALQITTCPPQTTLAPQTIAIVPQAVAS